ncbi:hypothetical protein [Mycobacterium hubeiense]|uniref:hypothetical protein n=1 Tax=Mycobacterium hubeiense TaxID=1867256 RepID=UPI001157BE09|nr:hypothetical protein [Mycobacterium sp. QGD 101]
MTRKLLIAALVAVALVAGIGVYFQVYKASQQPVFAGPKPPMDAQDQAIGMLPATPLDQLPEPDRTRFAERLREAAQSIKPGYRIEDERLFLYPGGFNAVEKISGSYLSGEFGYQLDSDASTQVNGQNVDYLIWRSGSWLRSQFDDRIVAAVQYSKSVDPDSDERLLGYFVMRPS